MSKTIISILFVLSFVQISIGQHNLVGRLSYENEPIPYAQLLITPIQISTVTDFEGKFEFKNLPQGKYTLKVVALGYKPIQQILLIPHNGPNFSIEMKKDVFGLEEVTVTANRSETSRRTSPIPINVMNSAKLEQLSANSISDGIKFSPGLRMENNCQNCGFSQVRINGLPGAYSQILIDGKSTFSALNSIYGLEQIPTDMVNRIEIIKGGGSALYGSNAIAGTINLITKQPINNSASFKTESSFIGAKNWEQIMAGNGSLVSKDLKQGVTVFANYRNRNPYDHNSDGFTEIPKVNNLGVGARAFQKIGKQGILHLELHSLKEYRRGGDQINKAPNEANIAEELKSTVYGGSVSVDLISKNQKNKTSIYSGIQSSEMDNYYGAGQDANGFGKTTDFSTISGIQFINESKNKIAGKGEFLTGMEYKTDNMLDEKPGYNLKVNQDLKTIGVYTQYNWQLSGNWILNTGIRSDWYNLNNASNLSPRLNLLYNPSSNITLRTGYSRGFRIPQVFSEDVHVELVAGEIQAIQLDPNLDAEISDSYTASMDWDKDWTGGVIEIIVEGFFTQIHNPFILEERNDDATFSVLEKRNGAGAQILGTNLEFKISDQKIYALQAGYTFLQSEYEQPLQWSSEANKNQLVTEFLKTPNAYGNLILDVYPIKNGTVTLSSIHTGSMLVPHFSGYVSEDVLKKTEDFLEINIKLSYDIKLKKSKKLTTYLGIKNILNSYQTDFDRGQFRDASYVYGPMAPRTYFVGVKWRWNK